MFKNKSFNVKMVNDKDNTAPNIEQTAATAAAELFTFHAKAKIVNETVTDVAITVGAVAACVTLVKTTCVIGVLIAKKISS